MIFTNRTTQMVSEGETCSKDRQGDSVWVVQNIPQQEGMWIELDGEAEPLVSQQDRTGPRHPAQPWAGLVRIVPFVRDFPKSPVKVISQNCSQSPISLTEQTKGCCFHVKDQPLKFLLSSHLWEKSNQLTRHFARSSAIPEPGACLPAQDSRCESSKGPAWSHPCDKRLSKSAFISAFKHLQCLLLWPPTSQCSAFAHKI